MSEHRHPDQCDCECHDPGCMMMHFMPCCHPCQHCGINVVSDRMEHHDRTCAANPEVQAVLAVPPEVPGAIYCVFSACKCPACGRENAYHRMGCGCWDMVRMMTDPEYAASLKMEYGMFYRTSDNTAQFISNAEIKALLVQGRKVFDPDRNELTLAMFET